MPSKNSYRIAIQEEIIVGTLANSGMKLLNVDKYVLPNVEDVVQKNDVRHGEGSTAKAVDNFECTDGSLRSYPIEGIADTGTLLLLVQNVITNAISSGEYLIPWNYGSDIIEHGDDPSTIINTFSMAMIPPYSNTAIMQKGCIVRKLKLFAGGIKDDNGRIRFKAIVESRYAESRGQSIPSGMTNYTNNFYYMSHWITRKIAGISGCIVKGFSLEIDNPAFYGGDQNVGDPQTIERDNPEIKAILTVTVKHTAETDVILQEQYDNTNSKAIELSNHATWASATNIGFKGDISSVLKETKINESGNKMYIDVVMKLLAGTSGNLLRIKL